MPAIKDVRPVLLSAPYADMETNLEVYLHLPHGYRTTGMVEIILEDGTKGLGEGYAAVFAPRVFEEMIHLLRPYLIGKEILEIHKIYQELLLVIGYWSMQGAAMHALSAVEIALQDCKGKVMGLPVYQLLGEKTGNSLELYGSGGDSRDSQAMEKEFDYLASLGIGHFKIRARKNQVDKAVWCINEGKKRDVDVAIDMTQNLQNPGQSPDDVLAFVNMVEELSGTVPLFLEEVLGPSRTKDYPDLRSRVNTKIAGGEIVTTPEELCDRIESGAYDISQPDATVIGGITGVMKVFEMAKRYKNEVVVHCWGGPVGMMANFHASLAGGGKLGEWPMPVYPLRQEMVVKPWEIKDGFLEISDAPGLGVELSPEIERKYAFREEAVYECLVSPNKKIPSWK